MGVVCMTDLVLIGNTRSFYVRAGRRIGKLGELEGACFCVQVTCSVTYPNLNCRFCLLGILFDRLTVFQKFCMSPITLEVSTEIYVIG